jgi:flagellar biosynthetic protein FliR
MEPKTFLLSEFYAVIFVFARFAGLIAFFPGFSEKRVPVSVRLLLALILALCITPTLPLDSVTRVSHSPDSPAVFIVELLIGVFGALTLRLILSSLDLAGSIIGYNIGLSNVFVADVATQEQSALLSSLLSMIGLMFIFVSDFHHAFLLLMANSYTLFPLGATETWPLYAGDGPHVLLQFLKASFVLGLQLSIPVIILNMIVFTAAGIMNRLMPVLQIFFILQPAQILLGFILIGLGLGGMMSTFMSELGKAYVSLVRM